MEQIRFGDIYLAKLVGDGHEQHGVRAVVIAQNDKGNLYAPTVEIIPMSARINKARHLPTHVFIKADEQNGLKTDSLVLAEQTNTIDKTKLIHRIGSLTYESLVAIGVARQIQSPFPTTPI